MKIRLASKNPCTGLNNIKYMKPYEIYQDGEVLYNYLAGYFSDESNGSFSAGSIRLSSILRCSISSAKASLSKEEIRNIEDRIQEKGVQFLPDNSDEQEIRVLFTEEGKKMYRRMFHLRPLYIASQQDNPNIFIFRCTIRQAENYIFNFGHNATVLSPRCLQDKLKEQYESASTKYNEMHRMEIK